MCLSLLIVMIAGVSDSGDDCAERGRLRLEDCQLLRRQDKDSRRKHWIPNSSKAKPWQYNAKSHRPQLHMHTRKRQQTAWIELTEKDAKQQFALTRDTRAK